MRGSAWFQTLGLLAWLCCSGPQTADAGKVLVIPVDGSHWLSMKILVKELVQKGHEAVVLVPETSLLIKQSETYKTEIYKVPYSKESLDENFKQMKEGVFKNPTSMDLFVNLELLINFTSLQVTGCESLLKNKPLMTRLRNNGFDAVLTDPFLPCGPILSHLFKIPVVYFLRGLPCGLDLKANQCPSPLSYVPVTFSGNTDVMTFPQRVKNVLMSFVEAYMCKVMYREFDLLANRYLSDVGSYKELLSRGALWLMRYNFIFEYPQPIMPNMVYIGGINCAKKAPLPADVEEFVEGSGDDGFIIFTLGSMVANMPEEKARQFFDAFGKIPQRVLWRYNGVVPENAPKNVKVMNWLPQKDLLAHPKAKLFMTHGGTHGIYEGICNGVPMLMFPLFGDQGENVKRLLRHGAVEKLDIYDVTSEKLVTMLKKMIEDKSYKEKMDKLSQFQQDQPIQPLELALFWTEFIMRHKGAEHLRVAAHNLNWFQYHSLDVLGFLAAVTLAVLLVLLKCCLCCARRCLRAGKTKKE